MINTKDYNLIVVLGPTATGKTRFAALLADKINAEIISADSRQVYKYMDLGTGKDYEDYIVNDKTVPYHLVDIHEPGYKYNVYEFQSDFFQKYKNITERGKRAILCGGTGMYIESITKQYRLISVPINEVLRSSLRGKTLSELAKILSGYKKLHNKSDTDTVKRAIRAIEIAEYYENQSIEEIELPMLKPLFLGVNVSREIRRERITKRLKTRLKYGMIEEVKKILDSGVSPEDLIYYGLEYKYVTQHLIGEIAYSEMESSLNTAIHQFAKRQMTWFRKMEREGVKIHWIDGMLEPEQRVSETLKLLGKI